MTPYRALITRLQTGTKQSLLDMRSGLIAEALSWEGGTLDDPVLALREEEIRGLDGL
jgi:hypothetical protein